MASPPRTSAPADQDEAGRSRRLAPQLRRFRPKLSVLPLRSRGFRLLVIGQGTSEFGNAFQVVTLPLLVYAFGGDSRQLSFVVAAYGFCRLAATPLGGMLADRLGAWRVMMASDVGRVVLTGLLAAVAGFHVENFYLIGTITALVGLCAGLFQPSAWAITPSLLPAEQLQAGNSLNSTITFAAGLVGPGVAGLVVVYVSQAVALTVDALTFAVSVITLLMIGRGPFVAPAKSISERAAVPRNFFALLRESRLLRNVLTVTVIANLTMGGMTRVALPSLATHDLGAGARGLGGLLAAFTGGALVGGLLSAGFTAVRSRGTTAMFSGLVMGVAVGLIPVAGFSGALILLFTAGAASTVVNVMIVTGIQKNTPPALLARVMAAITFCGLGVFPLSVIAVGAVVDAFGSRLVFAATGVCLVSAFCFALTRREMRGL